VETSGETAEKSKVAGLPPRSVKKRAAKSCPKTAWGKLLSQCSKVFASESFTVYLRFSGNEVHGLIRSWGFSFV